MMIDVISSKRLITLVIMTNSSDGDSDGDCGYRRMYGGS